jgi:hypothetical protein
MARAFFLGYQRERYARWKRLSPLGKAVWAVKKVLLFAVVTAVVSGAYLWSTHESVLRAVFEGTAGPTALVVPVLTSIPVLAVVAVVSLLVVLWPQKEEWDHR